MSGVKPKVFIASSVEGLPVADAINANLDHDTYPTLWRAGTFRLGSSAIVDIVKKSSAVDFAVFVFTPDDVATIRTETTAIVRDNVLFELGLFIGALGKERCYVVRPRGVDMHLPSDLLGVTTADYASDRPDGDLASALNAACKLIKDEIAAHGPIEIRGNRLKNPSEASIHTPNPPDYELNVTDLHFLAECAESHTGYPGGLGYHRLAKAVTGPANLIRLSATKLLKLGYIEKSVEIDERDGDPYYAYSITSDGLDIYVKNEEVFAVQKRTKTKPSSGFDDLNEDAPF